MFPFVLKGIHLGATPDAETLDDVAKQLTVGLSRRRACQALGGGALGAVLAGLGLSDVLAGCRGVGERCRRNGQCCSGRCHKKKCRRARSDSGSDGPEIDPPSPSLIPLPPAYELPVLPTTEQRRVAIGGTIDIIDDEYLVADEVCHHRVEELTTGLLTPGDPTDSVRLARGCGGEVRVEVELQATLRDNGDVTVSGRVYLFEGTSESTTDLDGVEEIAAFVVRKDASITKEITVRNEREGGDYAVLSLTFRNIAS